MKLTVLQGNVFDKLPEIPGESIDLCITSPPYWGLRDYGVAGQLGNEPTMEAYLDNTLKWVKEVWRVLKPTGSFVLNIGDCFLGGGRAGSTHKELCAGTEFEKTNSNQQKGISLSGKGGFYKPKQLLSVSSFAYCRIVSETNFVCRGEHIWCKPNVPSPIRSRLKHSHEKLFWFVKDADKYYFDSKVWLKKITKSTKSRYLSPQNSPEEKQQCGVARIRRNVGEPFNEETIENSWRIIPVGAKANGFELEGKCASEHVAPFPENLIHPYIQSMCQKEGTVLDPFLGSGTTMRVAMENSRSCTGIELNPNYIEYAKKRVNWGQGFNVEYYL